MRTFTYRPLTTLDDYARVVELERIIWGPGYDDVVPVSILGISVFRGGILIGAFDGDRMVGFVYSLPAIKHGRTSQWSHMLGVVDDCRNDGLGHRLKLLQRERTMEMGLDLIEWTYDPMQALNAHLNFTKLGVVVHEYEINVYGTSNSPLHAGNPTDRFVAEWNILEPHVERRLAAADRQSKGGHDKASPLAIRAHDVADAAHANELAGDGPWPECADTRLDLTDRRIAVQIPMGFTEMLIDAPETALRWRMATREIFTTYFSRGYKAVDFALDRPRRRGAYLLAS